MGGFTYYCCVFVADREAAKGPSSSLRHSGPQL